MTVGNGAVFVQFVDWIARSAQSRASAASGVAAAALAEAAAKSARAAGRLLALKSAMPRSSGLGVGGAPDVVLCVREAGVPNTIKAGSMEWLGDPVLLERPILPLALLEPPCIFRAAALRVLEADGRPFRIIVESASLSGVRAALQAGLAVTGRNPLFIDPELTNVLQGFGLPSLPGMGFALHVSPQASAAAQHLAALAADMTAAVV